MPLITMPSSSLPHHLLFLLLLVPLLLFSSSPISSAATSNLGHNYCVPQHLSALLQLKHHFNLTGSLTNLSSWNTNQKEHCCSWEGVTCNTFAPAQVIGLNLSQLSIAGVLDFQSLFHLRSLERLDLSHNDFDASPIPSGFSYLSNLTHLHLDYCNFYGQIPSDISNLTRLVSLDLSFNFLKVKSSGLGEIFRNLSSLRELYLDRVNMSSAGSQRIQILADALPNNLRELSMQECGLSGPIHPSFSRLHFLTYLDLRMNSEISSPVPQFIANFTSLTSLRLRDCGLHGEFPKSIFSLPKLQILDISSNPFLTISLPKFFINSTIQQLMMPETNFTGNLADFLGNFKSLTDLDLRNCSILGPITQSQHVNISQLRHLDLANNNFQGPIPRLIFELTQLTGLDLSSNNFHGVIDLGLFHNFKYLSFLDLSYNSLTVIDDAGSNSTSTSFPQLSSLFLRCCNISKIPDLLRNQQEMMLLDLSCNRISGKIPQWIWAVGSTGGLFYLNLSHNALEGLEGSFPRLSLRSMEFLDLSANFLKGSTLIPPPLSLFFSLANNSLDGDIPPLICDATSLQILDLSSNHFTGVIPQCLGEISGVLSVLNLRKNHFRGALLQTFKRGCWLETLDVSHNELEGEIPKSLANCQWLRVLNLGNNHFQDAFPSHLANLSELSVLVLRSNQFHGSIGSTAHWDPGQAFFPHLQIIDVSFNNLGGRLPSNLFSAWRRMMQDDAGPASEFLAAFYAGITFQDRPTLEGKYRYRVILINKGLDLEYVKILTALTLVDLSHNQFHGDIPSSIGELKSLHALNMSHNHFQGQIPPSLGNLKQLESLDLSQNSLSGEIPQQLSKLSFLEAVNLSENHLSGSIPQGGQFGTFQNNSFVGNPGLCGPPLSSKCNEDAVPPPPPPPKQHKSVVNSMWMGFAVGHSVGFGGFFWTMVLWRKGRHSFFGVFDRVSASVTALFLGRKLWCVN